MQHGNLSIPLQEPDDVYQILSHITSRRKQYGKSLLQLRLAIGDQTGFNCLIPDFCSALKPRNGVRSMCLPKDC